MSLELGAGFSLLAHGGHALDHELEAVPAPLGTRDCLFNLKEGIGIIELLAQIFDEWVDFGVDQEHLAAETGLKK
jgi:hypothetical protein